MAITYRSDKSIILFSALAIFTLQVCVGTYAVYLNKLFYTRYGPFYDSLSYFNGIAEMSARAQMEGRLAVFSDQIGRSTVFYPWLVFAPFAGKVELARSIAVYIQISAAIFMQFAIFAYFYRQHRDVVVAFVFSSVFMGIAALFWFNGGIADFRMDLMQYFFYATVLALYLTARRAKALLWWVALGVSVGLMCMARATSAIYLLLVFAVVGPADVLWAQDRRRDVVLGFCMAAVTAMPIAGWFYGTNLKLLYYYYFIWNLDANAKLSMVASVRHILFTFGHIGAGLAAALVLRAGVTVFVNSQQYGWRILLHANWRALWFGAVPVGYLVVAGAGLNPFVSILGAAGFVMFLLEPLAPARIAIRRSHELALMALVLVGVAVNVAGAVGNHSRDDRVPSWIPRQDGLRQLTRAMLGQMRIGDARDYRYGVAHFSGGVTADTVFNTLVFDERLPARPHATIAFGSATLAQCYQAVATAVEWESGSAATDDERIDRLVELLNRQCDFFVMVEEGSQLPPWFYSNRFVPEINRRLLRSGAWQPITMPLLVSPTERVTLLRNRARDTNADGAS
jgi:hypothetical protein